MNIEDHGTVTIISFTNPEFTFEQTVIKAVNYPVLTWDGTDGNGVPLPKNNWNVNATSAHYDTNGTDLIIEGVYGLSDAHDQQQLADVVSKATGTTFNYVSYTALGTAGGYTILQKQP